MTLTPETINSFANPEELAELLAVKIADILQGAIVDRNNACLIVSGGSTPIPLFKTLSKQKIDWSKVSITLADERWIDVSDKESNENLVRRYLLRNKAHEAAFIGLKTGFDSALKSESLCEKLLQTLPRADVLILGMGLDGHTASLFPDAPQLVTALDMHSGKSCMAITPEHAPHHRMTLTLPTLLNARSIFLHITGKEKLLVLQKAFGDGPVQKMPIRAILRNTTIPVSIFWSS